MIDKGLTYLENYYLAKTRGIVDKVRRSAMAERKISWRSGICTRIFY